MHVAEIVIPICVVMVVVIAVLLGFLWYCREEIAYLERRCSDRDAMYDKYHSAVKERDAAWEQLDAIEEGVIKLLNLKIRSEEPEDTEANP